MKPVTQTKFGRPGGNCFTACLASILEVELDQLADIARVYRMAAERYEEACCDETRIAEWAEVWEKIDERLARRFGVVLAHTGRRAPRGYSLAGGPGPRELQHCVVFHHGVLAHDPHPSRAGLSGEVEDFSVLIEVCEPQEER